MSDLKSQKTRFLEGLGDQWLERNRPVLGYDDIAEQLLDEVSIPIGHALELGCANGWRLKKLRDRGYTVRGLEPSSEAVTEANRELGGGVVLRGTADSLPFKEQFDLVHSGFALSFCDPRDYPIIVAEIHRVLKPGGYLLIYEAFPEKPHTIEHWYVAEPNIFGKKSGDSVIVHAYEFDQLFIMYPGYEFVDGLVKDRKRAVLIKKSIDTEEIIFNNPSHL